MSEKTASSPVAKPLGRYRELRGFHLWYFRIFTAFAALLSFVYVFKIVIFDYVMPEMSYFAVLIAAFVSTTFLLFPATKSSPRDRVPWCDTVMALASIAGPLYIFTYNLDILLKGWEIFPPLIAKILALITWVLIIEAVRRAGGTLLAGISAPASSWPNSTACLGSWAFTFWGCRASSVSRPRSSAACSSGT
jgi:TRAP-type uncharacterized transport system fused permease subunit